MLAPRVTEEGDDCLYEDCLQLRECLKRLVGSHHMGGVEGEGEGVPERWLRTAARASGGWWAPMMLSSTRSAAPTRSPTRRTTTSKTWQHR